MVLGMLGLLIAPCPRYGQPCFCEDKHLTALIFFFYGFKGHRITFSGVKGDMLCLEPGKRCQT